MKIVLEKGQSLFFTSDTHYGHTNICRATTRWTDADNVTRDFESLEHMNTTIVDNINEVVGENDILIHLGDFSFGGFENIAEFRSRIICKNIHLVLGNHDHHIERNKENIQHLFTSVNHYINLDVRKPAVLPNPSAKGKIHKFNFILMHFPIASWDGMNDGVMHLHGHVHLPKHQRIAEGRAMDVGVDGNDMYPMGLYEVLNLLKDQPVKKLILPKDHHEKRI
jgi:calcineurin-like phosphoesterase family protein